jgi:hypothetical protein
MLTRLSNGSFVCFHVGIINYFSSYAAMRSAFLEVGGTDHIEVGGTDHTGPHPLFAFRYGTVNAEEKS